MGSYYSMRQGEMKYDNRYSRHARFIIFLRSHYHNGIVHEIGHVRLDVRQAVFLTRQIDAAYDPSNEIRPRFLLNALPSSQFICQRQRIRCLEFSYVANVTGHA